MGRWGGDVAASGAFADGEGCGSGAVAAGGVAGGATGAQPQVRLVAAFPVAADATVNVQLSGTVIGPKARRLVAGLIAQPRGHRDFSRRVILGDDELGLDR